jgi:hypothetical protein
VTELSGIALIDFAILCVVGLMWGIQGQRKWAWWGSVIFFATMTASWVFTLAASSWSDILTAMDLPPFEMEMLQRLPLQGFHLAILAGAPLVLTVGAILRAKGCFEDE